MYTFLICQDNSIVATEKERIMEKSSLVDKMRFIVEKQYNGYDMAEFDLLIEAFLPITHEVRIEKLEIADNNYKDLYYVYELPINSQITKEAGDVSFSMSFVKTEMDGDVNILYYIRRIETGHYKVLPVETWFAIPDTALDQLTQLYLQNKQSILALRDVADSLANTAPNDMVVDGNDAIRLAHDGVMIGNGITVATLKHLIEYSDNNIVHI